MSNKTEAITKKQWENYGRRIEKKNLREKAESLTFTAICRKAYNFIIETHTDNDIMIVKKGWRKAMKG